MDTDGIGCFLEIGFIAILLFILCLMLNDDNGDKTEYIVFVLIAYFIYKLLKNIKIE